MSAVPVRPVRIPPLPVDGRDERTRELLLHATRTPREVNIYSTLVRNPQLFRPWIDLAHEMLHRGSLAPRDRELLILRTAWRSECEYEWAQHVRLGRQVGLADGDLTALIAGPADGHWSARETVLLRAVDELVERATVLDATWNALAAHYDTKQLVEILMIVGTYRLTAGLLNALGVPLDAGLTGFPGDVGRAL